MKSTAEFGDGGDKSQYRYRLIRDWREEAELFMVPPNFKTLVLFVMLNPSTADATKDDPTVAKCIRLARRWGFGGIEVQNIFALRSTNPAVLKTATDPVGPQTNLRLIHSLKSKDVGAVVAAWGNGGKLKERSTYVRKLLEKYRRPVYAFRISGQGEPEHPLYQKEKDLGEMVRWI